GLQPGEAEATTIYNLELKIFYNELFELIFLCKYFFNNLFSTSGSAPETSASCCCPAGCSRGLVHLLDTFHLDFELEGSLSLFPGSIIGFKDFVVFEISQVSLKRLVQG
ncbi:hypothetical protein NDU88_005254, partial [Pleurodeles waltl]